MPALPTIVDGVPLGSEGQPLKSHQEWDSRENCPIGTDPRKLTVAELGEMDHSKRSLLSVIRDNCIDCAGSNAEVRRCAMVSCPFWPYRLGSNPFQKRELSEEQRAAAAERLRHARKSANAGGNL